MNKYVLYNVIDLQSNSVKIYKRHFVGIDFVRKIADKKVRNETLGIKGKLKTVDIIAVVITREKNPIKFLEVTDRFKILFKENEIKKLESLYRNRINVVQNTLGQEKKKKVGRPKGSKDRFPSKKNHFAKLDSAKERARKTLDKRKNEFSNYLKEKSVTLVEDGSFKNMYSVVNLICEGCGGVFSAKATRLKARKYPCKKCGERIEREKRRYEKEDYVSA